MLNEVASSSAFATAKKVALEKSIPEDLLALVIKESYDDAQVVEAGDMLGEVIKIHQGEKSAKEDTVSSINQRIADIDELLADRLDQVLHHAEFKKLESAWRGLDYLVSNTDTSSRLQIRVMNIEKRELAKDLEKAVDFDQSTLFKKIYEAEYGTFGGHPFSFMVGDFSFSRSGQDISMLSKLANVAAAAHAPFIAAAGAGLFDIEDFTQLARPRDLAKTFQTSDMAKWSAFRASDDARYVALTLPRMLLREPYSNENNPAEGLNYDENMFGKSRAEFAGAVNGAPKLYGDSAHEAYLWGNPAYALGQRITEAFAKYGWTAAIRGVEGGGAVTGLPLYTFPTDQTGKLKATQCPTEVTITDRREKELNDLGFISLCHKKNTDLAVFFGGQTAAKPPKYDQDLANANAQISAMLPYVLSASRFAHYLKVIMRDKIGGFADKASLQAYLNKWIAQYVLLNDNASQDSKARFPLREGRIDVTEIPGKKGAYRATAFLKPHFQLEELTTSLRLVAELPQPAK